ncbi:MAG TPA: hypothetical protein VLV89_10360 [Candidatus Acidoferrum sp.]|nr:hypothetical protein [Candidatus Acidoferrum sp.]
MDRKHYLKMGDAIWLFLYLLREQTGLNQHGEGIVNYGHPLTFRQIGCDMKDFPAATIRRWATTLRCESYIRTADRGHDGLIFWIAKGKPKTRTVKITHEEARSIQRNAQKLQRAQRADLNAEEVSHRADLSGEGISQRSVLNGESLPENPQVVMHELVAGFFGTPIPKGFTSENLSYYNKESHAQTACSPIPSFKEVLKEKTAPRGMSQAKLDERRRQLLRQAERIRTEYPARGNGQMQVTG